MNNQPFRKIKVLIVDDSIVSQKLYQRLLEQDSRFEVVGIAGNGKQAIEYVAKLQPDVVSMDINMPLMDGVEATRQIMQQNPIPITIVSSLYNPEEVEIAMRVLEAGAVNIISKPNGPGHPKFESDSRQYLDMLRMMSEVKVVRRRVASQFSANKPIEKEPTDFSRITNPDNDYGIVVIGASAGGPEALKSLLGAFNPGFPLPILIVQHIDPNFAEGYRTWLQSNVYIPVVAAEKNQKIKPGFAYIAPGDYHLEIISEGVITLTSGPPVKGLRPAVANLFRSAADAYGKRSIAVILSGMGADGAAETALLRSKGAMTFAQNEPTCLVFGMPGEAIKSGGIVSVLPPREIANAIMNLLIKA